jgi:hypothetical protein
MIYELFFSALLPSWKWDKTRLYFRLSLICLLFSLFRILRMKSSCVCTMKETMWIELMLKWILEMMIKGRRMIMKNVLLVNQRSHTLQISQKPCRVYVLSTTNTIIIVIIWLSIFLWENNNVQRQLKHEEKVDGRSLIQFLQLFNQTFLIYFKPSWSRNGVLPESWPLQYLQVILLFHDHLAYDR